MKKKISALFASVLAVSCLSLNFSASALWRDTRPFYCEGENFTCSANEHGTLSIQFNDKVECKANFMITGAFGGEQGAGLYSLAWISYDEENNILRCNDTGCIITPRRMTPPVVSSGIDNVYDLDIGDLIYINGYETLDVVPGIIHPTDKTEHIDDEYGGYDVKVEDAKVEYVGNVLDIFGEDFMPVVRHEARFDFKDFEWFTTYYQDAVSVSKRVDIIKGDATEDEAVNILDVITINKSILGRETLCNYARHVSDVDENGTVDSNDALNVLKYIVGLKENLEVEE